ncbi:MAG: hypothetical protein KKF41_09980 [Actinobacteria bacterium]|nr:hypothetical protein [Actinomycetota bacterium]MBU1943153.1 hypothetical protein [Actinomycetota bacterium]MBU2687901.1 hypothetical protein [Actinomycetota bacterium]
MTPRNADLLLGIAIVLPFALAVPALLMGGVRRMRRLFASLYAGATAGFGFALLAGFLTVERTVRWGPIRLDRFTFPLFLMVNLLGAAVVLYAGFRRDEGKRPGLLHACMSGAIGFAGLAVLSRTLPSLVIFTEAVTVLAFAGLAASGATRRTFRGMLAWLASDALFVLGAVLCRSLLAEKAVLIQPPLTRGTEAQVVTVVALFLAAAALRLGAFPFAFWLREVADGADTAWSALFLGVLNFVLSGFRLVVAAVLLARLVAGNWGPGLVAWAAVTVVVGAWTALRAGSAGGFLAGIYSMQGGLLLMGLALFSRGGLGSTLFILMACPVALAAAFMASGTASDCRGSAVLEGHGLSARLAPAALVSTLLAGLSLSGAPPLAGFPPGATLVAAGLERASVQQAYALAVLAVLAGVVLATAASIRLATGLFDGSDAPSKGSRRPEAVESLVMMGLCLASLLLGLFPGLLATNFAEGASFLLFERGFAGPVVVIKGSGPLVEAVQGLYKTWGQAGAAFLLVPAVLVMALYLANRAARPSAGDPARFAPFVGGATVEYPVQPRTEVRAQEPAGSWFPLPRALQRLARRWNR